jgi:anti-sigma factor RsiW
MSSGSDITPFGRQGTENEKLSEDKLMAYLEGKLPPSEQHNVEQWLSEEGMESDALEGLRSLRPEDTLHAVDRLKHGLRKKLTGKRHKRKALITNPVTFVAIVVILLLAAIAYIVLRYSIK